ncbi:hypothetical protein BAUCODRAFT_79696 [Baudoinia panamericana UAMH 10762]|uniref:Peptidase A1 domain-containing protein n=1 Tax=Baudoinia panamericana (strain UAMH 10762) TaxID=717646 RepID=M2MK88_BAUPA|nr:uncharacterized protein BAUCODRAFT_79696 [Baudoinia panamericana UAMH 10762]EMC91743.1 hypothetical protein BAUCODRAFT_79696 [Baudoinia panamericana UAMH 10762]
MKAYAKYGWEIIILGSNGPIATISNGTPSSTPTPTTIPTSSVTSEVAATSAAPFSNSSASSSGTSSGMVGEVVATPEENESEYLEPVTVGGQVLNMDFDTGSADFWVFSSSLPASQSRGHSTFDPSKSSTWQPYSGGSWDITYGDGTTASGTVGYDVVNIGGATATRQAVEVATYVSSSFTQDTANDGLVGLAFSKINTVRPQAQQTFFDNVKGQLKLPIFTANLEDGALGTYTFGEIDPTEYSGEIYYMAVDSSNGFWEFDSKTYTIGGSQRACTTCSPAIADTGTSLILVDDDVATAYWSQVAGATLSSRMGGWVYPCSATLPTFGIAVGGYMAMLNGTDLEYSAVGGGKCFGGVQSNQGGGLQILGDVLLKNYFAVFDAGNERFGIAEKA